MNTKGNKDDPARVQVTERLERAAFGPGFLGWLGVQMYARLRDGLTAQVKAPQPLRPAEERGTGGHPPNAGERVQGDKRHRRRERLAAKTAVMLLDTLVQVLMFQVKVARGEPVTWMMNDILREVVGDASYLMDDALDRGEVESILARVV